MRQYSPIFENRWKCRFSFDYEMGKGFYCFCHYYKTSPWIFLTVITSQESAGARVTQCFPFSNKDALPKSGKWQEI